MHHNDDDDDGFLTIVETRARVIFESSVSCILVITRGYSHSILGWISSNCRIKKRFSSFGVELGPEKQRELSNGMRCVEHQPPSKVSPPFSVFLSVQQFSTESDLRTRVGWWYASSGYRTCPTTWHVLSCSGKVNYRWMSEDLWQWKITRAKEENSLVVLEIGFVRWDLDLFLLLILFLVLFILPSHRPTHT